MLCNCVCVLSAVSCVMSYMCCEVVCVRACFERVCVDCVNCCVMLYGVCLFVFFVAFT